MLSAEHNHRLGRRAVTGTLAAVAAAMAAWTLAQGLGQPLLVVGRGAGPVRVPLGAVVVATLVGGAAGWGLAALAARTRRPRAAFLGAVAAGLALSAIPPVTGGADAGAAGWLLALHAVVAAAIVPPLATALPWGRPTGAPDEARARVAPASGRARTLP